MGAIMPGHDPAVRGIGGVLIASAAALFAHHSGMSAWETFGVFALTGLGFPLLVGGRLSNW